MSFHIISTLSSGHDALVPGVAAREDREVRHGRHRVRRRPGRWAAHHHGALKWFGNEVPRVAGAPSFPAQGECNQHMDIYISDSRRDIRTWISPDNAPFPLCGTSAEITRNHVNSIGFSHVYDLYPRDSGSSFQKSWNRNTNPKKKANSRRFHSFYRNIQMDRENTIFKDMYPFLLAGSCGILTNGAAGRSISRRVAAFLQAVVVTIGILLGAAVTGPDDAEGTRSIATGPLSGPDSLQPFTVSPADR